MVRNPVCCQLLLPGALFDQGGKACFSARGNLFMESRDVSMISRIVFLANLKHHMYPEVRIYKKTEPA